MRKGFLKRAAACIAAAVMVISCAAPPVSAGADAGGVKQEMPVLAGERAQTEEKTLTLDITGGLTKGKTYMDGMVSVGTDMSYKAGSVTIGDKSYPGYITNGTNPSTTDGTGALLRFEPEYDGTVQAAGQLGKDKVYQVYAVTGGGAGVIYEYENSTGDKGNFLFEEVEVEAGNTYYIYAKGTKMRFYALSYTFEKPTGDEPQTTSDIPAFPGAEGGGKYITGGRGRTVYTVTNLKDDAGGTIEGSLRWAMQQAKKNGGGTIVFQVSGNIELSASLRFDGMENITIAGQTAPGDGITISGFDTNISNSENIIIRYMRFRPGAINVHNGGDSMDAMWGRDNKGFVIDHCSFSWNTDECLSLYRGEDGTVQWCMVYESLTLSGHSKGRHGYGAIAGGDKVTFHHNLYADHTSRNPRIGGGYAGCADADHVAVVQLSNNIIYNWGFNTTYGGGYNNTNFINNYAIAGPGTREQVQNWVINPGESTKVGGFYIKGNYITDYSNLSGGTVTPLLTLDNISEYGRFGGVAEGKNKTTLSDVPYTSADSTGPNAGVINKGFDEFLEDGVQPAETIYEEILNKAGATYPRRDAMDARIAAEVRNGLGRYINTENEVGGYLSAGNRIAEARGDGWDTDGDGMPDDWEDAMGLDSSDAADGSKVSDLSERELGVAGYTNLEVYLSSLVDMDHVAENPDAEITYPADNAMVEAGEEVTVTVEADSHFGHTVEYAELYYSTLTETVKAGEKQAENGRITFTLPSLPDGSYFVSARVYDDEGNATQTTAHQLHINVSDEALKEAGWSSESIGNVDIQGYGNLDQGVLTVKGNGKLGKAEGSVAGTERADAAADAFHYVYKELEGDMEITAKLESISSVDNHAFAGIMVRADLEPDAAAAALGLSWTKTIEDVGIPWSMYLTGRDVKGESFDYIGDTIDDVANACREGIVLQPAVKFKNGAAELGYWMRLVRRGNEFTAYSSSDGKTWEFMGSRIVEMPEKVYVGFAAESNRVANEIEQINTARFSNIHISTNIYEITYQLENVEIVGKPETVTEGNDIRLTVTTQKGYRLPATATVTIGNAKPVEVELVLSDPMEGVLTLKNVMGPVTITLKAEPDKTGVEQVKLTEIDNGGYLTVTEEEGALILTQTATAGNMTKDTGVTNPGSKKLARNISYYVFPKTTETETMELDVTILDRVDETSTDKGLFVGVFEIGNDREQFSSLGFRNVSGTGKGGLTGYWTKAAGNSGNGGSKCSNGMPNDDPHTKPSYELGKTYHVVFEKTKDGYRVSYTGTYADAASGVYPAGAALSTEMDLYKVFSDKLPSEADEVQYGFALLGVTAKIENLKLSDAKGRTIYLQNDAPVSAEAWEAVTVTVSGKGVTKEEIIAKLPAQADVKFASESYQKRDVTWDTQALKEIYKEEETLHIMGTVDGLEAPVEIVVILKKSGQRPSGEEMEGEDSTDDDDTGSTDSPLSVNEWKREADGWYFFDENARAVDGWQRIGDKWYYFDKQDKKMRTGWQLVNGSWYLLDAVNGDMKTGWQLVNGSWYLLDAVNGDMRTGWQLVNGSWYLLDAVNGDMKTGWQLVNGSWYLLDAVNGDMKTGWQLVDGSWYYLTASGAMAAAMITPDGFRVDEAGAWVK